MLPECFLKLELKWLRMMLDIVIEFPQQLHQSKAKQSY